MAIGNNPIIDATIIGHSKSISFFNTNFAKNANIIKAPLTKVILFLFRKMILCIISPTFLNISLGLSYAINQYKSLTQLTKTIFLT